jgi:hypothetical protein
VSDRISLLEAALGRIVSGLRVPTYHVEITSIEQIDGLAAIIDAFPGETPVWIHAEGLSHGVSRGIEHSERAKAMLTQLCGIAKVWEGPA